MDGGAKIGASCRQGSTEWDKGGTWEEMAKIKDHLRGSVETNVIEASENMYICETDLTEITK